jgi:hypothetical protein
MKRTLVALTIAIALAGLTAPARAQAGADATKPATGLTAEQILDKYVEVTGGRDAYLKHTSLVLKGNIEIVGAGINGVMESYAVAPNRFSTTIVIAGFGTIREIYDGEHGWESSALNGIRELSGPELAILRRQATFNADLNWRDMWKSVELVGTKPVGDRMAYVVKLTPKTGEGDVVTNFYDTETFLLVRSESIVTTDAATVPVVTTLSDYRVVGGIKLPFVSEQQLPSATMRITATDATFDVKIDDAKFAKPVHP